MNNWFKSGSPWVWLSAGGVSISLISVIGLLWLIASRGLSYFWPADIYQFEMTDEQGRNSLQSSVKFMIVKIFQRHS